jgi:hypothetical protein
VKECSRVLQYLEVDTHPIQHSSQSTTFLNMSPDRPTFDGEYNHYESHYAYGPIQYGSYCWSNYWSIEQWDYPYCFKAISSSRPPVFNPGNCSYGEAGAFISGKDEMTNNGTCRSISSVYEEWICADCNFPKENCQINAEPLPMWWKCPECYHWYSHYEDAGIRNLNAAYQPIKMA